MQCLFFIWRPGHHRSSEELQGLGKGVMGDSKFKNSNVHMDHTLTTLSYNSKRKQAATKNTEFQQHRQ